MMDKDLRIIKKKYGEKMMHLCRELFSTIIDNHPGVLSQIMLQTFAPNHFLYDDIVMSSDSFEGNYVEQFKIYIYSIYDRLRINSEKIKKNVADPVTLMKQAGYTLYECKTEADIQKFKKYYAPGEELCTFNGGRLKRCYVYFAVRDDADKLERSNFYNPNRQDKYGTSVISVQFTRDNSHTLSIKNRYNHTVINPDATYANDLDNIVPGLTQSFADYYGMEQKNYDNGIDSFEMWGYVQANDGKLYKYNYEMDNIYYCPGNIIIDNFKVIEYEKEKYLVMDYFILDLVNKRFVNQSLDLFPESFTETIGDIKKIRINNVENKKVVTITPEKGENIVITLDKFNQIINLKNNNLVEVPDNFLRYNETLEEITIDNAIKIGDHFLRNNYSRIDLLLPNVKFIGGYFLENCKVVRVSLPKVECVGDWFMDHNYHLESVELPMVQSIGRGFLEGNNSLRKIYLPEVTSVGEDFLFWNKVLDELSLPKVVTLGNRFCHCNQALSSINLPCAKIIGDFCFGKSNKLSLIILPQVEYLGCYFAGNSVVNEFYAPLLINNLCNTHSEELRTKSRNKTYKLIK